MIDVLSNGLVRCTEKQKYVTLSYVWVESGALFTTLKSNFSELEAEQALMRYWDQPPATIKDSMTLTKALGIQYLWADRLYIVRNDHASIDHSIAWMASICANSWITIVAAEGHDANFGLKGIGSPRV